MLGPGRAVRGRAGPRVLADGGEEPEIVGEAGEQELAGGVVQAAEAEAAQAAVVFEAGVQSFDVGGAAACRGRGPRRCAAGARWPRRVPRPRAAGRRRARSRVLPPAMSRSGPGAVRFASLW